MDKIDMAIVNAANIATKIGAFSGAVLIAGLGLSIVSTILTHITISE